MGVVTDKWEEANKDNLEGLSFIDDGKRKLFYRFSPSKKNSFNAPLLVILHGHGTKLATKFQRDGWNVLSPVDHFGYEGNGCWWLGENGDFFVKELLQKLIKQKASEYNSENNIYFYGSSMGGYGAILHGILCGARAIYANVPQIKLLGTNYSENSSIRKSFEYIFGNNTLEFKENNLLNWLDSERKFPVFYLCENIIEEKASLSNYLKEHTLSFLNQCYKYQIKSHFEILPQEGHTKNYGIKEVIDKFMRFTPPAEPYQDENIANIFYPTIIHSKQEDCSINKTFLLGNGKVLKIDIEGLFRFKFLYADEKCLIVQKNSNTLAVSFDEGKTFSLTKTIKDFKIFQIYPLSNGNYLLGGTEESTSVLYVLDSSLNILKKHDDLGERTWHAHGAIDEAYGIVMYIDYQNFDKNASLPQFINIFRSKDFGLSWEKVYSLKHPEEVRHGHTLQADPYKENTWLATTGDTPSQSRWFLSNDNGNTWIEITDKSYVNDAVKNRSLSAHRTTSIDITEDYYYFSTDDLMGSTLDYFIEYAGERKASSKFYRANKTEPIKLEKLTNLGIHGRSMIDVGDGYIIVTEAKYVSFNSQVFYIDKSNLTKAYFLFDIYGNKRHAGTASMNSVFLKQRYFYTAINRGQFLDSDIQSLKWNITIEKNKKYFFKYNIENYIKFEEHLWFVNNTKSIDDISFQGNSVHLSLKDIDNAFYLLLGDKLFNRLKPKQLFSIEYDNGFIIEFDAMYDTSNITFFVEFYDDKQKVYTKSHDIVYGKNSFNFKVYTGAKYIKILFRMQNNTKDNVALTNLSIKPLQRSFPKKVNNYIQNLNSLDIKFYLLTFARYSDSSRFKPRKDLDYFDIKLPLDWDIDPFNETNWKFQLHALRLLDRELTQYMESKEITILERIIEVVLDWKRDIIDNKKNFDFNREENPDSFAWHDMATGLRALKISYIFEELIKLTKTKIEFDKYLDDFYLLVKLHIEALSKQDIAPTNHAIYQIHGLMMLLRLFPDDFENISQLKQQTEKNMIDIFYKQFFKEGIHKENSSRYHYLAIETFQKILSIDIYPDLDEIFIVLDKAKTNCAYMHFPNLESLMTGDSDYKLVTKEKGEWIEEGITLFEESGYTYIYEQEGASMLYLNTAFLNRTHKHADFFNVLFYEYGKNILVDAGKYSYVKDNPFRKYCISTRAHNTVLIDNQNYKLDRKYFFESKVVLSEKKAGYYHIKTLHEYPYLSNTIHERNIFYKPKEFLFVLDIMKSDEIKNFKQLFHLHQDLDLVKKDTYLYSQIQDNVAMYINMKSIEGKDNKLCKNISFNKGIDGEIEGYRALGHNEVVENYVLVNEIDSAYAVMGSMFSFNQLRDFEVLFADDSKLEILFENYHEIIKG